MSNQLPNRVPILDAAAWLSTETGRKITPDYLLELYRDGKITLKRYAPDATTQTAILKLDTEIQLREYRENWYISLEELMTHAGIENDGDLEEEKRPVQRLILQEKLILSAILKANLDPQSLPIAMPGMRGTKHAIREQLLKSRPDIFTQSVFKKAWERLRADNRIDDAPSS